MSECAALQTLRDDMPILYRHMCQGARSMLCFTWQDNLVLMSRDVRDAMRTLRAVRSGDELDI